jgi:hypothetical protein
MIAEESQNVLLSAAPQRANEAGTASLEADTASLTLAPMREEPTEPRDTAVERARSLLWPSLAVAVGTRLGLLVYALVASYVLDRRHIAAHLLVPRPDRLHGFLGHLLDAWVNWDGVWYVRVASHGYRTVADTAFYPLYPLLLRGMYALLGSWEAAGVVVSATCFIAATALLYRLLAEDFGAKVAFWSIVFLSLAPTSFFFQATYRESLFLLLSVAMFHLARHQRWLLAGSTGMLATLTHSTGLLLVIPLAILLWTAYRRGQLRGAGRLLSGALALLLIPLGMLIYMAVLLVSLGDPLAFMKAETFWGRHLSVPWRTIPQGLESGYHALLYYIDGFSAGTGPTWPRTAAMAFGNFTAAIALIVVAVLILLSWRRLPLHYWLYGLAVAGFPLMFSTAYRPLLSLPRLVLPAFPLFIAAALLTQRRPVLRWVLVSLSTLALGYLTLRYVHFAWVA